MSDLHKILDRLVTMAERSYCETNRINLQLMRLELRVAHLEQWCVLKDFNPREKKSSSGCKCFDGPNPGAGPIVCRCGV